MKIIWLVITALLLACPVGAAEQAGVVKIAKGTVTIERAGQKATAAVGAPVFGGDRLTTGADGSLGIALRDNTLLSAGPKSSLTIDGFSFNSTTHAGAMGASLRKGTLAVVSGKIAKQSPDAVQFRTPSTILGIRGTEFVLAVPDMED